MSIFERPKKTGNRNAGTGYGNQPYNPELIVKLGDIFRVFYNYCLPDEKNKKTPAMKLGLAKGPVKVEKSSILNDTSRYQTNQKASLLAPKSNYREVTL